MQYSAVLVCRLFRGDFKVLPSRGDVAPMGVKFVVKESTEGQTAPNFNISVQGWGVDPVLSNFRIQTPRKSVYLGLNFQGLWAASCLVGCQNLAGLTQGVTEL